MNRAIDSETTTLAPTSTAPPAATRLRRPITGWGGALLAAMLLALTACSPLASPDASGETSSPAASGAIASGSPASNATGAPATGPTPTGTTSLSTTSVLDQLEAEYVAIVQRVSPSVVVIAN